MRMTADVLKEKKKIYDQNWKQKKVFFYFPLVIYYNPLIQPEQSL